MADRHNPSEVPDVDPRIVEVAQMVTDKRPRTVIDHLIQHGTVNSEELQELYGYTHPPRAVRDVREAGIPIETEMIVSARTGRRIAEYRFGDPSELVYGRHLGRRALPASLKMRLIEEFGEVDGITGQKVPARNLQVDHRVPYEIAGDSSEPFDWADFMLLDASMQRTKAFTCSECPNMNEGRDVSVCSRCYWAYPEDYDHVATRAIRRIDVEWRGDEVSDHDAIRAMSEGKGVSVSSFVKSTLRRLLGIDR